MNAIPETAPDSEDRSGFSATYSPDDNKLRLYSLHRLDQQTYHQAKRLGFRSAPKQDLFVAPMWTPEREDFLLGLCGEIADEDKSLVERAEERADRFGTYSDNRATEAERAHQAVRGIADNIPLGQPILVGHHSERRARKDAQRINNGMRRAVNLFETSEYWARRAAGALRTAKYKERADVRYRRIKGIEADQRRVSKDVAQAEKFSNLWKADGLTLERAIAIANFDYVSQCFPLAEFPRNPPASQHEGQMGLYSALVGHVITAEQAAAIAVRAHARTVVDLTRWLTHYKNRLCYERAMLDAAGGTAADRFDIQVGGEVLVRSVWVTVVRVTRKEGEVLSVTTNARYGRKCGIEEVKDYRAPSAEQLAIVLAAIKLPPLANYPGAGFIEISKAQWGRIPKDYKGTATVKGCDSYGTHRSRSALGAYLLGGKTDWNERHHYYSVFIADAKRKDPPAAAAQSAPAASALAAPQPVDETPPSIMVQAEPNKFDRLKSILQAGGAKAISAPQLFPTPHDLARRMVALADIRPGKRVLEPHVGTLRIFQAIAAVINIEAIELTTVEIDHQLSDLVRSQGPHHRHICDDFLKISVDELGKFDFILMNPPFADAVDIKHIEKGFSLLEAGGRLVAVCANGSRQQAALKPLVAACGGVWEDLPANTFKESGTDVNTALVVLEKE